MRDQRGKVAGASKPPVIRRDHQIPWISDKAEFECLIPCRTQDAADVGSFRVFMVHPSPDWNRSATMEAPQSTVDACARTFWNMYEHIFQRDRVGGGFHS